MNNLIIALLMLIVIAFFTSSKIAIDNADEDDFIKYKNNKASKLINDKLALTSIKLGFLISLAVYYILLSNYLSDYLNDFWPTLITAIPGSLVVLSISILPVINISEKRADLILIGFRPLILLFKYLLLPFSYIFILISKLLYKPRVEKLTEDELIELVDKAEEELGINKNESQLIKSVLDFDELKVLDIYTPRVNIVAINNETPKDKIINIFRKTGYSRLPVYEETIDNIIGIINHKDFYNNVVLRKESLDSIIQQPVEVTEYMDVSNLLTLLKINKAHMAIVKDEYGGTLGIITMEDILEELVGDIWDEHDEVVELIRQVDPTKYLVKGNADLDDLIDIFDLDELEDEDYVTVNGWVLSNLGRIGIKGDTFTYRNLEIEVVDANEKKVIEILITIQEEKNLT